MGHAVAFGVSGVVEGAGVAVVEDCKLAVRAEEEEVIGCVLLRLVHADGEGFDGFGVLEVGDRVGSVFCDFGRELGFLEAGGTPDELDQLFPLAAEGGGGEEGDRSVVD